MNAILIEAIRTLSYVSDQGSR